MLRYFVFALAMVSFPFCRLSAEPAVTKTDIALIFHVPSAQRRYAILIQAPVMMRCALVRYSIEGGGAARVSAELSPGELELVHLIGVMSNGPARIRVTPLGCAARPEIVRRVILGKASPDHSWRTGKSISKTTP